MHMKEAVQLHTALALSMLFPVQAKMAHVEPVLVDVLELLVEHFLWRFHDYCFFCYCCHNFLPVKPLPLDQGDGTYN